MADPLDDRRYPASPRLKRQARREGRSPRSRDLASALVMLAALLGLMLLGGNIADQMIRVTSDQLQGPANGHVDPGFSSESVVELWHRQLAGIGQVLLPLLGLIVLAAVAVHAGQVGFLFLPERALPKASHINPLAGLRRIFSVNNTARWLMGITRLLLILGIAGISLWTSRRQMAQMVSSGPLLMTASMLQLLLITAVRICCGLVLLGGADYAWHRWRWEQEMKMTGEQFREEQRLLQGGERRRPADRFTPVLSELLICSSDGPAIGLSYHNAASGAPLIWLRAEGAAARQAQQRAEEEGRHLVHDDLLARQLFETSLAVGESIDPGFYRRVARLWPH